MKFIRQGEDEELVAVEGPEEAEAEVKGIEEEGGGEVIPEDGLLPPAAADVSPVGAVGASAPRSSRYARRRARTFLIPFVFLPFASPSRASGTS